MPLISAIIPVYNTSQYLARCIESICNQTLKDIEIILVDDGSTDESPRICDKYALQDARITVIHQINSGVSSTRNTGLNHAIGEYVHFIDSDDFLAPSFYEEAYKVCKSSKSDILCCATNIQDQLGNFISNGKDSGEAIVFNKIQSISELLKCGKISYSICDKVFSGKLLKEVRFNEAIYHNEDFLFCYEVLKRSRKTIYTPNAYYYYCFNEGSQVHSKFNSRKYTALDAQTKVLEDIKKVFPSIETIASTQFYKVVLYLAYHMSRDKYKNFANRTEIRNIVKSGITFILRSELAFGYKINALSLVFGWSFFRLAVLR